MTAVLDGANRSNRTDFIASNGNRPKRFEIVYGKVFEVDVTNTLICEIANRLNEKLVLHAWSSNCGESRMAILYETPLPEDPTRCRRPRVAFTTFQRWPPERPISFTSESIDIVPDLAVEVVSPTDDWEDVVDKAYEYLRAGVRLVWLITPKQKQVYVYKSRDDVRIVNATDTLDGGDVLPGFEVNVGALFPPVAVTAP